MACAACYTAIATALWFILLLLYIIQMILSKKSKKIVLLVLGFSSMMAIGLYGGMQYWEYPCELALVADQLPITSVVMSCAFVAEILNDTAAKIIKLDSDHESETKIYVREAVAMLVLTQITMIVIVIATGMQQQPPLSMKTSRILIRST
mmetsp:Transcript_21883/g.40997  ORF Transcript_21883/g.40997 Transcript_21883/m.40997 type:complete len:150 (+) Transcript_21883:177-626(+)